MQTDEKIQEILNKISNALLCGLEQGGHWCSVYFSALQLTYAQFTLVYIFTFLSLYKIKVVSILQ
jgi:hypothetical protein